MEVSYGALTGTSTLKGITVLEKMCFEFGVIFSPHDMSVCVGTDEIQRICPPHFSLGPAGSGGHLKMHSRSEHNLL